MSGRRFLDSIIGKLAIARASRTTRQFFKAVERSERTQDRLMAEFVRYGASSAFGRDHHFERIRSYSDFKANIPVRSYDGISSYIQRVREGDVGALFSPGERILMFALTSGTTAEPKTIPITPRVLADSRRGWNIWGLKAILDHPGTLLRQIVQVTSPMNDHLSPSGVPCGAITGLLAASQKKLVRRYYTSPFVVSQIADSRSKYYTIMRLAIPQNVAWIVTANPSTLLLLASVADENRDRLLRDIHDGTLSSEIEVDGETRSALASVLHADPACAARLEALISEHGRLCPKHYWNLGFRAHWRGGTMGLYEPRFDAYYGDTPGRDIGLIASEGRMSIPVEDGTAAGILSVMGQFFEFIPAEAYGSDDPPTLRSHELTVGDEYFLVLTNASGLYRYDVGDRVRVTGHVHRAPVIEFLCRDAHTSSMTGEKLTEDQVVAAMQQVSEIVDFVLAPRWAEPPRYRVYLDERDVSVSKDLAQRFESALCEINVEYAQKRETLRLETLEVASLPAGFLAERDITIRKKRTRTAEQFKHQYLLPQPGMDDDLEAAVRRNA